MFLLNAVAFAEGLSASSSLPKPLSTISPELCKQSAKQTMSRLNATPLPSRGPCGPQDELKLFFRMKRALHHTVSQTQTLPRLPPTGTCSNTTSVLRAPCICPASATMLCPPCTGSRPPPRLIWQAPHRPVHRHACSRTSHPSPLCHRAPVPLLVTLVTHDTALFAESTDEG